MSRVEGSELTLQKSCATLAEGQAERSHAETPWQDQAARVRPGYVADLLQDLGGQHPWFPLPGDGQGRNKSVFALALGLICSVGPRHQGTGALELKSGCQQVAESGADPPASQARPAAAATGGDPGALRGNLSGAVGVGAQQPWGCETRTLGRDAAASHRSAPASDLPANSQREPPDTRKKVSMSVSWARPARPAARSLAAAR